MPTETHVCLSDMVQCFFFCFRFAALRGVQEYRNALHHIGEPIPQGKTQQSIWEKGQATHPEETDGSRQHKE